MALAAGAEEEGVSRMEIILGVVYLIGMVILFSFGFFLGYKEGMQTMKRIDDNIIEEAKRCIYGEE